MTKKIAREIFNAIAEVADRIDVKWILNSNDIAVIRQSMQNWNIDYELSDDEISYLWILKIIGHWTNDVHDFKRDTPLEARKVLLEISKIINEELHSANAQILSKIKQLPDGKQQAVRQWIDKGIGGFSELIERVDYVNDKYLRDMILEALDNDNSTEIIKKESPRSLRIGTDKRHKYKRKENDA